MYSNVLGVLSGANLAARDANIFCWPTQDGSRDVESYDWVLDHERSAFNLAANADICLVRQSVIRETVTSRPYLERFFDVVDRLIILPFVVFFTVIWILRRVRFLN